jgi:hypothetical protein
MGGLGNQFFQYVYAEMLKNWGILYAPIIH